jgi:hypothetical protein
MITHCLWRSITKGIFDMCSIVSAKLMNEGGIAIETLKVDKAESLEASSWVNVALQGVWVLVEVLNELVKFLKVARSTAFRVRMSEKRFFTFGFYSFVRKVAVSCIPCRSTSVIVVKPQRDADFRWLFGWFLQLLPSPSWVLPPNGW